MKSSTKIFILSLMLFTLLSSCARNVEVKNDVYYRDQSTNYAKKAFPLFKQKKYAEAAELYEKAIKAQYARSRPQPEFLSTLLMVLGECYLSMQRLDEAAKTYEKALEISRELKREDLIALLYLRIGLVYNTWGKYNEAMDYFKKDLELKIKLKQDRQTVQSYLAIALVYYNWGQYDLAVEHYEKAIDIATKFHDESGVAGALSSIAEVFYLKENYPEAIEKYEEALKISTKMGNNYLNGKVYNGLALTYDRLGQYLKALENYNKALAIQRKINKWSPALAATMGNIATHFAERGEYQKSINLTIEMLKIYSKLKIENRIATCLNNIGSFNFYMKNYPEAIKYFERAVTIKEKLRKTAKGDIRRDYLASQIDTYQFLTSSYLKNDNTTKAFSAIELSRAKLLAERLRRSESDVNNLSVDQVQKGLDKNKAILIYANVDTPDLVQITITKEIFHGNENSMIAFLNTIQKKYGAETSGIIKKQRALKKQFEKKKDERNIGTFDKQNDFESIVMYYRRLLTNPTPENNKKAKELSNRLYSLLLKPLIKDIKDKKELIIVPDGILGLIPFETLIDENGKYIAERYDVKYAQSVSVLDLIKKRKYREKRKPLIAFGGAVYERKEKTEKVENSVQFNYLEKSVYVAIENNRSIRSAYSSLEMNQWDNLPGTLKEVNDISKVVKDSTVFTGKKVNEKKVKEMSVNGELAKYKVIHFATHGLVVPEIPELSAVVLSQIKDGEHSEDGYLTMAEIAKLDIKADFVNLSACETGLGKIYSGEGIVGLTQSFLIAGANALSVSLWQVADESTSRFMVAMYELVGKKGMNYNEAMMEVKRRFINGEFGKEYSAPYYWSPFVYYGQ